ncbi:neuronal acetylcholine receptor subunit beta-4, partial [Biomphalaria glabrata]
ILTWDPSKYGNQELIHPTPEKIWRPRVFLLNTLGARDLFQDDVAPIFVRSDGNVNWIPGNLFATSCELHLKDFPFDEQTCTINLVAMMYSTKELLFVVKSPKVKLDFFIKHSEWNLADTSINVTKLVNAGWEGSRIQLTFLLQRRPTFLLINLVLPVVFLSFLNLLVFIIPADSGEKISYGITVLLALSMFLSIVSNLLPRSGEGIPKLTIYLFLLLVISMLTVIDSIMIVYLTHKNEQETSHLKAKANFQRAFVKTKRLTRTLSALLNIKREEESRTRDVKVTSLADALKLPPQTSVDVKVDKADVAENKTSPRVNKYRLVSKHIDCISFIVFLLLWLLVTLGFLFNMAFGRKD